MTMHDTQRNIANPNRVRNLTHEDFREGEVALSEDGGSDQAA